MKNILVIENEFLKAEIKTKGGELCRLYSKKNNTDLLWNGNPAHWGRHAPVLFPIVGKVKKNEYQVNGNTYELGQHGFARDTEFSIVKQHKKSCTLQFKSTAESLKKYPFEFLFTTTFTLEGNQLTTSYQIKNTGTKTSLFSLGAHPAFNCPINNQLELSDYELKFEQEENADILLLGKSGLISDERSSFLNNTDAIALNDDLFINDALIFDDLKSKSLTIQSKKDNLALKVSWFNFPHLGIWKPLKAPFICIEPWQGMADFESKNGELESKFGVVKLNQNEIFNASYDIAINQNS